jgi:hypothetical protein
MTHLTLQEVIERINKNYPLEKESRTQGARMERHPHRPEFYIPRIAMRLVQLRFSGFAK